MHKVNQIIDILDSKKDFHNSVEKAVSHRDNFSKFLLGQDEQIKPITVDIVPSLECNQNCSRCTYVQNQSKNKIGHRKLMSLEIFNKITDQLKDTKGLIFTGGGEPLLNSLTPKFMQIAKNKGFDVALTTNATLLNKENIKLIIESRPTFIRCSLNAGDATAHSRFFQSSYSYFNQVIENIISLAREKERLSSNTTIGLGFIISEKNFNNLDAISELLNKLSVVKGIDYADFRPEICYFDENLNVAKDQINKDIFKIAAKEIKRKIHNTNIDIRINTLGFDILSREYTNKANVVSPWSVSCDYDGKFYLNTEYNGMPQFEIGDINKDSFHNIWNNKTRQKMVEKMNSDNLFYYKLLPLNLTFSKIRDIGRLSEDEVDELFTLLPDNKTEHINFI